MPGWSAGIWTIPLGSHQFPQLPVRCIFFSAIAPGALHPSHVLLCDCCTTLISCTCLHDPETPSQVHRVSSVHMAPFVLVTLFVRGNTTKRWLSVLQQAPQGVEEQSATTDRPSCSGEAPTQPESPLLASPDLCRSPRTPQSPGCGLLR